MPGHSWDPEKKRFFRILPGQVAQDSTNIDKSTSKTKNSTHKGKLNKRDKGKRPSKSFDEEAHYATTQCLPRFRTATLETGPFRTHGACLHTVSDPVTLRQHGRRSLGESRTQNQQRIEGAYSHLALFRAQRPFRQHTHDEDRIVDIKAHADGQSLVLLSHTGDLLVCSPIHDLAQLILPRNRHDSQLLSFLWSGSRTILHATHVQEGQQRSPLLFRIVLCPTKADCDPFRGQLPPVTTDSRTFAPMVITTANSEAPSVNSRAIIAWAVLFQGDRVNNTPQSVREATGNHDGLDKTMLLALSAGRRVQLSKVAIRLFDRPHSPFYSTCPSSESDTTAITFDQSGDILYCGTRSGAVLAWFWRKYAPQSREKVVALFEAKGSVTNLHAVSSHELLVVRIDGQVQLFNTMTGEVKREFVGHVNAYDFKLGCAIDAEVRLLALAGLDRRVRVWSLDSSFPLGTSADQLSCVYHAHRNCNKQDTQSICIDPSLCVDHPATRFKPTPREGTTLSSVVFPKEVRALHWHPRFIFEGQDANQVRALWEVGETGYWAPQLRWKDLCAGVGEWLYLFRWP
nr:putative protein [Melanopsichium pennsylvanicum 4]